MRFRSVGLVLLVAALPPALQAQNGAPKPYQFTIEDYARAERMLAPSTFPLVSGTAGQATWLPDGRFWYRATTASGWDYILVNPAKPARVSAFDKAKLAAALSSAAGGSYKADSLPFGGFAFANGGTAISVSVRGKPWTCDLAGKGCTAGKPAPVIPRDASLSPDSSTVAYIKDYNLWAKDLRTGTETQLTTDGVKDFGYATNNAGWVHSDSPVLTWSDDSKHIATFQHDGRGVRDMVLGGTEPGHPRLEQWKYPLPGDSVVFSVQRVVINLGGGTPEVVRLKMAPDAHRSTVSDHIACDDGNVCDLQWYPDGSHVAFISSSRDHRQVWFRVADAVTGEVREVLHEESKTQIGDASLTENLWKVLPATNELIWWSERDNWIQLYLYDLRTGALKNRITTGDGNVSRLVKVDEKARQIWFTAVGREPKSDPYFNYLYRVGFDGKGLTLLTPDNGNHAVSVSPDGKYFVDTWSTPDTPPVTVLRNAAGKILQPLEKADIGRLLTSGWRAPIPVTVKARDGKTDLYGLMYVPSKLDSTKKYPVIDHIYPGPQAGSVGPRSFIPARGDNQSLAELGFIVVELDGMGTPWRSKAFHDFYYGNMGDNTIPDQVAGLKELGRRYGFIDIDKVGIWGHSGGGFATASAMFDFPDFFKVGISESGNHDNRVYEDDWGERYQGPMVTAQDSAGYNSAANQSRAAKLKGKLFLIHGMMDDNVPPYNTQLVVNALMRAGKDFDQIMLPDARHGYGKDAAYIMRRRWDYFISNLQGNVPPKEYQIGRPRPLVP
ncbi:MAG: DPP IV N-terminal domain-containing protein [Gemmatimonadales bacterium]